MFKNALRKVFANGSVRLGGGVLLLLILMSILRLGSEQSIRRCSIRAVRTCCPAQRMSL